MPGVRVGEEPGVQLARAHGRFDHIIFAVLDRQRGAPTHAAFTRVASQAPG